MGTCTSHSNLPKDVIIAHFTPSFFPVYPVLTKRTVALCARSWTKILSKEYRDERGVETSGMTMFYNDFYERLAMVDADGKFEAVLTRHSTGGNKIAAKGAILLRIMKFILVIQSDCAKTHRMLNHLGRSHIKKDIRPWQYSTFVQTLLITISSRLGTDASFHVMEAWVNLFAYIMKYMLPAAIGNHVDESEIDIQTSSDAANAKIVYGGMEEAKDAK